MHESEDETEIAISIAEVENSVRDFTLLDDSHIIDDLAEHPSNAAPSCSNLSNSNTVPEQSEDIFSTCLEARTITENSSQDEEIMYSAECDQNHSNIDMKPENDISVGYDIISDYPSSGEEAIALNSNTNELDKAISASHDSLSEEKNSIAEFKVVEGDPSAPYNPTMAQNYEYVPSVCYPDILSQIPSKMNISESHEKLKPFTEVELSNLYYNTELRNHSSFVHNFIEIELKSGKIVNHSLYQMLTKYLSCRDNLSKNKINFETLIEDCKQFQEQIWTLNTSSFTEYGECQVAEFD